MKRAPLLTALAAAVALSLTVGVMAQATPTDAQQKELARAREDLRRAAQRVAELSREIGGREDFIFERRLQARPVLGVILEPDPRTGVHIAAVTPESAAAQAGLRSGDRIVSIDGKGLAGNDGDARLANARARLRTLDSKNPVALGYERDGRKASVQVTPKVGDQLIMIQDFEGDGMEGGSHALHMLPRGGEVQRVIVAPGGVAPQIRREIVRVAPDGQRDVVRAERDQLCDDGNCRLPLLTEALRWNGLHLASVDPQLGRYFGTDHGVLVLAAPGKLGDLQPGDVMQNVDGKAVNTPREAMLAARARAPGSAVRVEYLRDRKRATTTLTLPEAMPLELPLPPPPPAAPPAPPMPAAPVRPPAPLVHAAPVPPTPPVPRALPPAAPTAPMSPLPPEAPPPPPSPVL